MVIRPNKETNLKHTLSLRTFVALDALTERVYAVGFYEGYRIRSLRPYGLIFNPTYVVTLALSEGSADIHLSASTMISVRHDTSINDIPNDPTPDAMIGADF